VLLDETLAPGRYAVSFDAAGLATGVYVYRVSAAGFSDVKKMMVLK
jgi:hypothetical protein